jgi:hypothetical protein
MARRSKAPKGGAAVKERTGRWVSSDQIDRTATRARMLGDDTVHRVQRRTFTKADGHVYLTRCGDRLHGVKGAVLTTRDPTCRDCTGVPSIETGEVGRG